MGIPVTKSVGKKVPYKAPLIMSVRKMPLYTLFYSENRECILMKINTKSDAIIMKAREGFKHKVGSIHIYGHYHDVDRVVCSKDVVVSISND